MTGSRPARPGRGGLPLGAAAAVSAAGAPPRRRRRILRRGCTLPFLLCFLSLGAAVLWIVYRRDPLPIPEEFFPARGAITAVEVPRGAAAELDAAIGALIGQLPATIAFAGSAIEIPAGFSAVSEWSGPWRAALWKEGGDSGNGRGDARFILFVGGEGFGPVRGRAAREAARRLDGREGLAAAAGGGGLLLGDDRALVRECAARAEGATRRAIPRDGVRFWRDDPEQGAALELWWAPVPGDEQLLVRWRGSEDAFRWREWLLDHGVEVIPLAALIEVAGERRYRLTGARESLAELVAELGRW